MPWLLSLVFNGVLGGILGLQLLHRVSMPAADDATASEDAVLASPVSAAPVSSLTSLSPNPDVGTPPVLRWADIESDDYRHYAANLRAVGCPEEVIRDLLIEGLHQLSAQRLAAMPSGYLPPWANRDAEVVRDRERAQQLKAIEAQEVAALRDLIGFAWNRDLLWEWRDQGPTSHRVLSGLVLTLGWLPDDVAVGVLSIRAQHDREDELTERGGWGVSPRQPTALADLSVACEAETAAWLGREHLEEVRLRDVALRFFDVTTPDDCVVHFKGAGLDAAAVREIVRTFDLLRETPADRLVAAPVPPDELQGLGWLQSQERAAAKRQERTAALWEAIAEQLSPEQFADLWRSQDSRFREEVSVANHLGWSRETALSLYALRQPLDAERDQLLAAHRGAPQSPDAELQRISEDAARAVRSLLGDERASGYLEASAWWQYASLSWRVGTPPPSDSP